MLGIAAVLLLGFLFLGLIQGLLAGDPMAMLVRMARDLPLAVFGMVVTIAVGDKLLAAERRVVARRVARWR